MAIKSVNSKNTKIVAEDIVTPENDMNGAILGTYTGKCCDASVSNNNEMFLSEELFRNLFNSEEYKRAMEHGHYIGFLGHPEDPGCQDYKDACIVMRDCQIEDDGTIIGTFDVLNTPVGKIVKTMEDAGIDLGISIRGAGDVAADGTVDPETFVFRGFDLVTFPAYDDAIPQFTQLAASEDLEKQVRYKKICAAINKNMKHISVTAANEIQKNFNAESDMYKKLEARKADIGVQDECPNCTEEDKLEVIGKKLECMTDMFMSECEENDKLKSDIRSCNRQLDNVKASYERKLKHLERITRSQQKLMQDRVVAATNSSKKAIAANKNLRNKLADSQDRLAQNEAQLRKVMASNSEITEELKSLKNSNLIYKQKIECSNADIEDRDVTISELQSKLDKTVMASTEANRKASNRDEEVKHLKSKVTASTKTISDLESRISSAEELLHQYQQAYADIYATALGTSVQGLPVTASTSVRELENMIQGATNTANIGSFPASYEDEDYITPISVDGEEDLGSDLAIL